MNHARALRASTDAGLGIFLVMILGVVLWTTDEVLGWNLLPDWFDKYAQLLVIILSILAGFAVVISVMCSFSLIAEAAARKAGIETPPASRRVRALIGGGLAVSLVVLYGFHKLDQYRTARRLAHDEQKAMKVYSDVRQQLENRLDRVKASFTPEALGYLAAGDTGPGGESLARLLKALQTSTRFNPDIRLAVPAAPPYSYCVVSALAEPRRTESGAWDYLARQFLTDLPSGWEREALKGILNGGKVELPPKRDGVVLDTHPPLVWGALTLDDKPVAVLLLSAPAFTPDYARFAGTGP